MSFDAVFAISLQRRPDRRAHLLKQLAAAELPCTVFDAVDGARLPLPSRWTSTPGAWGCYLSHLHLIEISLLHGHERVLFLEDDVALVPDFAARLETFLDETPDWDALYLGGRHRLPPAPVPSLHPRVLRVGGCLLSHAVAMRPTAMRAVYAAAHGFGRDYDYLLLRVLPPLRTYAPLSWLAHQANLSSDIHA